MISTSDFGWGEEVVYNSHGKRDPFIPLVTSTSKDSLGLLGIETLDEIIVEGVVYDPKKGSIVVANNTVLREGEEIGNVKVIQVKPDGVLFSLNGIEGFRPVYQDENQKGPKA